MLDFLTNSFWVVPYRLDFLTPFMKVLPYFASTGFYVLIIAALYWRNPSNKIGKELGFLMAFGMLANIMWKNIFQHPRPPVELHLVPVLDPFGFPSGDVQVATIFWLTLVRAFPRYKYLFYFSILLIASIMVSRVYLGVHCILDVTVGLLVGLGILYGWHWQLVQRYVQQWLQGKTFTYWIMLALLGVIYVLVSLHVPLTPITTTSVGALIGLGLCWKTRSLSPMNWFMVFPGLVVLIVWVKFFPSSHQQPFLYFLTSTLKYTILIWAVYRGLPSVMNRLSNSWVVKSP